MNNNNKKTVKILRITRYEHSLIVSPRPVLSSDKTTKVKKKKNLYRIYSHIRTCPLEGEVTCVINTLQFYKNKSRLLKENNCKMKQ